MIIQDIHHLSPELQAQKLADHFSAIPNQYDQLNKEDIQIPPIQKCEIPQLKQVDVWEKLAHLRTNKSSIQGDIPIKIYKEFAAYITELLTDVYNASLLQGKYPSIYKYEISTPVPKKYPVEKIEQMRNISGLLVADKVFEKLLSEMIISDMSDNLDLAQFGNEKKSSIQHYLIKMIHRIHTALDNHSRREVFAVVANMIDWNSAFVRQCPKQGIQSFQENGVRNSLIPLFTSYFQDLGT